jgi:hypothetical protein
MKILLIIALVFVSTGELLSQKKATQESFFDILQYLPKEYFLSNSLEIIKEEFQSKNLTVDKKINYYSFNQPYNNIEISNDSLNINHLIFIDTTSKLIIIDNQFKKASIKIFNDTYPYLIGYSLSRDEHIAYDPMQTTFYQLNKNGGLIDITEQLFENLNFCKDNYLDKTLSYFKGTTNEINCNPSKLLFNFTETDTIWMLNCHYDIFEKYESDTLFNDRFVKDVYIARKYIMENGKLRLAE